jgi:hypothetical protein
MTLQANSSTLAAPAALRKTQLGTAIRVEPATCAIGAELSGVNLGDASRDDAAGGGNLRWTACHYRDPW